MPSNYVGQLVWVMEWADKAGPFVGIITRAGDCPVIHTFFPGMEYDIECTHWTTEDGTDRGWMPIPPGGVTPGDLFAPVPT